MIRFAIATVGLCAIGLTASITAQAQRVAGVEFVPSYTVNASGGDATLTLCGAGLQRYRGVFKAYAAALYQRDCAAPPAEVSARRLELSYFWSIGGDRFGRAAERHLKKTLAPRAYTAIEARLARLHRAYRAVRPGDRYSLTFVPGRGTELALNSAPLATVEGADFAAAYFGLWIGDTPLDEGVRDALRGGASLRDAQGDS